MFRGTFFFLDFDEITIAIVLLPPVATRLIDIRIFSPLKKRSLIIDQRQLKRRVTTSFDEENNLIVKCEYQFFFFFFFIISIIYPLLYVIFTFIQPFFLIINEQFQNLLCLFI